MKGPQILILALLNLQRGWTGEVQDGLDWRGCFRWVVVAFEHPITTIGFRSHQGLVGLVKSIKPQPMFTLTTPDCYMEHMPLNTLFKKRSPQCIGGPSYLQA